MANYRTNGSFYFIKFLNKYYIKFNIIGYMSTYRTVGYRYHYNIVFVKSFFVK
jgi:hypothetical protein